MSASPVISKCEAPVLPAHSVGEGLVWGPWGAGPWVSGRRESLEGFELGGALPHLNEEGPSDVLDGTVPEGSTRSWS